MKTKERGQPAGNARSGNGKQQNCKNKKIKDPDYTTRLLFLLRRNGFGRINFFIKHSYYNLNITFINENTYSEP